MKTHALNDLSGSTKAALTSASSMADKIMRETNFVYISGPMTGIVNHNFEAFHKAEDAVTKAYGHVTVLNPANNFDGDADRQRWEYMRLDIDAVHRADATIVLPGWRSSTGANLEVWITVEEGKPVLELEFLSPNTVALQGMPVGALSSPLLPFGTQPTKDVEAVNESVLLEAERLVNGPRQHDYGHPWDDFSRTARIWEVIFKMPPDTITPEQVALCMVGVKLSREVNASKRDNLVDMAGYAGTVEKVKARRRELDERSTRQCDRFSVSC